MTHTPVTSQERREFVAFVAERYKVCQGIAKSKLIEVSEKSMFFRECADPVKAARRAPYEYDLLEIPDGSKIADIGAGSCMLALLAQDYRGCDVTGFDREPRHEPFYAISRAVIGFTKCVDRWVGKDGSIELPDRYDVITMITTSPLSWLDETPYAHMIDCLCGYLSPGGTLILHRSPLFVADFVKPLLDARGAVYSRENRIAKITV